MAFVAVRGVVLLLLPACFVAQSPYQPNTGPPYDTCCYGKDTFRNGQTVTTLPECCISLVCNNGHVKARHFGPPGSSGCCEFDGQMYPDGARLTSYCVPLICRAGNWTSSHKIEECCKLCKVFNDPHFSTFDGYRYNWHGLCNYTITQMDHGQHPHVAIFSDFHPCFESSSGASCLRKSTFKNDEHTVLTLDHTAPSVFSILVNGDPFLIPASGVHSVRSARMTHPVLAWRRDTCTFLAGSSSLLVRHCHNQLNVWSHPSHTNRLYGLCGRFNFYQNDDMTNRNGTVHSLHPWPRAFPQSWKTTQQTDRRCLTPCIYCTETTNDPCRTSRHEMNVLISRCASRIHQILGRNTNLIYHVESCAWDMCMSRQAGLSLIEQQRWHNIVSNIVTESKVVDVMTYGTWEHQEPPTSGVCTRGSRWKRNCFWCICKIDATANCSETLCKADYQHPAGTDACVDGSWWKLDECNWCRCVAGGHICTYDKCTDGTTMTLLPITPSEDVCLYSLDTGSCQNYYVRFYYNYANGRCSTFVYSGCGGNANNFRTQGECEASCAHLTPPTASTLTTTTSILTTTTPLPAQCILQPSTGPCKAFKLRFYYNATTDTCEPFVFGGCRGNENNFLSRGSCEDFCGATKQTATTGTPLTSTNVDPSYPSRQHHCSLHPDPGACYNYTTRYYYNSVTDTCHTFKYGGCGGNTNNFMIEEWCLASCSLPASAPASPQSPARCYKDFEVGTCYDTLWRWYYNATKQTCEVFVYGGCNGNDNNFLTKEECQAACEGQTHSTAAAASGPNLACHQIKDRGHCFSSIKRFYYRFNQRTCEEFDYSGCGGNENNFMTLYECLAACAF